MADHGKSWKWLGDGSVRAQDAEEGLGHIVPLKIYNKVFAALVVCTLLTVWAATQNFGEFNVVIAITIATFKAVIVALFFMHLIYERPLIWSVVVLMIAIFSLLLGSQVGDEMMKDIPVPMVVSQTPSQ